MEKKSNVKTIPINLARYVDDHYFFDLFEGITSDKRNIRKKMRERARSGEFLDSILPRNRDDIYQTALKCVIANLLYCVLQEKRLSIGFRHEFYKTRKFNPFKISGYVMRDVCDYLCDVAGIMVCTKNGYFDPVSGDKEVSQFKPTRSFSVLVHQWQTANSDRSMDLKIYRFGGSMPPTSMVQLRKKDQNDKIHHLQVDFSNETVACTVQFLEEFNRFISGFKIKWSFLALESPMFMRIFTDDYEHHGRFFTEGGHYQNFKRESCRQLTIDGESVTEVDYSATHVSIAYHLKDLTPLARDRAYALKTLEFVNASKHDKDKLGKVLVNTAINAPSDKKAIKAFRKAFAKRGIKYSGESLEAILEEIKELHKAVAECFGNSAGKAFMFFESEICRRIMADFMSAGIPILPKHDSFIVRRQDRALLERLMVQHWTDVIRIYSNNPSFSQVPVFDTKY